jgi:hypothetical protein
MPSKREFLLWAAAVVLGVVAIIVTEVRLGGAFGDEAGRIVGLVVFFANIAVALYGIWRGQRVGWVIYLILSLALMVLIGANTPISAVWTLAKFRL